MLALAAWQRGLQDTCAQASITGGRRPSRSSIPRTYPATPVNNGIACCSRSSRSVDHEALADARRVGRSCAGLGVERRIVSQPRAKTGWDSLTDAELTVVNLIAQGVTNRYVATLLHLSLHTVKTHVHNAFAKLGINSRAQLTRLMHGSD